MRAIGLDGCRQTRDQLLLALAGRIEVQHQRTDLGAQEMIRAGGAERRQALEGLLPTNSSTTALSSKWPTLRTSAEISPRMRGMSAAAISRRRGRGSGATLAVPKPALPIAMRIEPLNGAIDDLDGGVVAVFGSRVPR